jgi:glutamate-ammonia-ligase adenylyltransferase
MTQNFASRLIRQPIAHDSAAAADIAQQFADLPPDLRGLVAATAGCSPYLKGLMRREADWLRGALTIAPETAHRSLLAALDPVAVDVLPEALRQAKRRAALLVALADLGGV